MIILDHWLFAVVKGVHDVFGKKKIHYHLNKALLSSQVYNITVIIQLNDNISVVIQAYDKTKWILVFKTYCNLAEW